MTLEITHFLKASVNMVIAEGRAGKYEDFAAQCGIEHTVFSNIMNHRTSPTLGQWYSIVEKIRELSPDFGYKFLKQQLLLELPN